MRILTFLLTLSPAAVLTQSTFLSHDLYGSAKSFSDQVILNPPMPHTQTGALWAKDKNTLAEWTLTLKFRVNGPEHGGRGMAIWYTTDRGVGGPVYGSADKWDGLGLFLTAEPDGTGSLRGHLNDGKTEFAKLDMPGANAFALDRMFAKTEIADNAFGGCTLNYRNLGIISSIVVSYNDKSLKVMHDEEVCFESFDVTLPTGHYFGASAQSLELADSHELFSFEVRSGSHSKTEVPPKDDPSNAQRNKVGERPAMATAPSYMQKSNAKDADDLSKIVQQLLNDNARMASRLDELSSMQQSVNKIEASLARIDNSVSALQHGVPASDPNFSPKLVYEDLSRQIRAMEDKFVQMEKHIEKQTSHIVASLPPPANGPIKIAVYVLILVQVVLGTAYIMYRRRSEEKSKFL